MIEKRQMADMPKFAYPLLGFLRDGTLTGFGGDGAFETCFFMSSKNQERIGMLLVDMELRTWTVTAVRRTGTVGSFWWRVVTTICRDVYYTVEYDFAPGDPIGYDEVKRRVCAAVDRDPYLWFDEEFIVGEAGPPQDEQALLDDLKGRIAATGSMAELYEVFRTYDEQYAGMA